MQMFTDSAGALLLALGLALLLANLSSLGLHQPHDPILGLTMDTAFWICGGLLVAFSLLCFFAKNRWLRLALILWLAVDFAVYQFGLHSMGLTHGFGGYLGSLAGAFGVTPRTAEWGLNVLFGYLLLGSCACAVWIWVQKPGKHSLKMTCAACGGHVAFTDKDLGNRDRVSPTERSHHATRPRQFENVLLLLQGTHCRFPPTPWATRSNARIARATSRSKNRPHHEQLTLRSPHFGSSQSLEPNASRLTP